MSLAVVRLHGVLVVECGVLVYYFLLLVVGSRVIVCADIVGVDTSSVEALCNRRVDY